MPTITIAHPSGQTRNVQVDGIPTQGDIDYIASQIWPSGSPTPTGPGMMGSSSPWPTYSLKDVLQGGPSSSTGPTRTIGSGPSTLSVLQALQGGAITPSRPTVSSSQRPGPAGLPIMSLNDVAPRSRASLYADAHSRKLSPSAQDIPTQLPGTQPTDPLAGGPSSLPFTFDPTVGPQHPSATQPIAAKSQPDVYGWAGQHGNRAMQAQYPGTGGGAQLIGSDGSQAWFGPNGNLLVKTLPSFQIGAQARKQGGVGEFGSDIFKDSVHKNGIVRRDPDPATGGTVAQFPDGSKGYYGVDGRRVRLDSPARVASNAARMHSAQASPVPVANLDPIDEALDQEQQAAGNMGARIGGALVSPIARQIPYVGPIVKKMGQEAGQGLATMPYAAGDVVHGALAGGGEYARAVGDDARAVWANLRHDPRTQQQFVNQAQLAIAQGDQDTGQAAVQALGFLPGGSATAAGIRAAATGQPVGQAMWSDMKEDPARAVLNVLGAADVAHGVVGDARGALSSYAGPGAGINPGIEVGPGAVGVDAGVDSGVGQPTQAGAGVRQPSGQPSVQSGVGQGSNGANAAALGPFLWPWDSRWNHYQGTIRATIPELRRPEQVGLMEDAMRTGRFRYKDPESQISGYRENGKYYVEDGNHRMTAAFNVLRKTGDDTAIRNLISNGDFDREPPAATARSYNFPLR